MSGYFLGTAFMGIGVLSILAPKTDYEVFGLPLERAAAASSAGKSGSSDGAAEGTVSPMVYAKGVRDLCYGLAYLAFQYRGMEEAITVFSAVISVTALGDGLVVWRYGGERLRSKAFGHFGGLVAFSAWLAWRVYSS